MLLPLNHGGVYGVEKLAGEGKALKRDVDGGGVSAGTLKAPGDTAPVRPVLIHTHVKQSRKG